MVYLITYNVNTREIVRRTDLSQFPDEEWPPELDEFDTSDFERIEMNISKQDFHNIIKLANLDGPSLWKISEDLTQVIINPNFRSRWELQKKITNLETRIEMLEVKVPEV